ncbi:MULTISPECIES: hypothetical protein [Acinetobacter]|jgi:hypothetical protein|uniref:Uncharacterized protein n=3 Tax=Acinetobacter schindleri TaxID=108981 RepID=N8Z1I5_9GAMM|nr:MULTISPECIES: hypothetical protein [Acinetobacter]AWD69738.1 hypothetical protein C0119_05335 [Acinetobacter schindleri]EIM40426.1 hypothetical protein HADU_01837 [Acinetobacter sp. HA]ENV12108.1 hypothetical protein F965_02671 [Acinetobacter schindleri NIPH 900]ENV42947.1 hypothetical protein F955_03087 [Acinetobacter schindleri CIP 107287]KMU99818.1 hypothetical protein ACS72_08140 [Acinetobacter sp. VT 511]
MQLRHFKSHVLMMWVFLAVTVSAITTTFLTKDLILDSLAISVSIIMIIGIILSGALLLTERIIKTCNS